jgi:two-component system sensor histidine kinase YesM
VKAVLSLYRKLKIKYKLILFYWPVTFLLISSLGIAFYFLTLQTVQKQSIEILQQTNVRIAENISNKLLNYKNIIENLEADSIFMNYILGNYHSPYEEYRLHKQFESRMEAVTSVLGDEINIAFIRYDTSLHESLSGNYHNKFDLPVQVANYAQYQLVNRKRLSGRKWFDDIFNSREQTKGLWIQVEDDAENGAVTFLYEMTAFENLEVRKVALVELTVPIHILFELGTIGRLPDSVLYSVIGPDNELYFCDPNIQQSSIHTILTSSETQEYSDGSLILRTPIRNGDMTLVSVASIGYLQSQAKMILQIVLFASAVMLVVIFAISYVAAQIFSKRITLLCKSMASLEDGNFGHQITVTEFDEVGYLIQMYNKMSMKIKTLIDDVYIANIEKKESSIRALQAQINPHFLYNSLSTVIRLSEKGRHDDISTIIHALVRFYRMTLNTSGELITIQEEIEQVKAFLQIYSIRMGEYANARIHVDESVKQCRIIPITIQPFVENVFKHAISDNGEFTQITINVFNRGSEVHIVIADNGRGMTEHQCEALLSKPLDTKHGYGVFNVNERIKLHFGNHYGVAVKSALGVGTEITIRIPKL